MRSFPSDSGAVHFVQSGVEMLYPEVGSIVGARVTEEVSA